MRHGLAFGILVLGMLVSSSAHSGMITMLGNRAAFNAAVGPTTTDDFGSSFAFPIATGVLDSHTDLVTANGGPIRPSLIQPGVTYSTPVGSGNFFNIDAEGGFAGGLLDGGLSGTGSQPLTVSFANPIAAFGFDTNGIMGNAFTFTIRFVSGAKFEGTASIPEDSMLTFFGFQSSEADILSAEILGSGGAFDFAVDNFSIARRGSVPEAPAASMVAVGLFALISIRTLVRSLNSRDLQEI